VGCPWEKRAFWKQPKEEDAMSEELRGTVLCVDDDEDERRALACLLEAAGLDVKEAATGDEGLRLAGGNPSLVVLDVNLPDIDGFEVCRRIKAHPATAAIPVLHLSGVFVHSGDVGRALAGGADGYLTKPVDPRVLLAWTKALLRTPSAEAEDRAAGTAEGQPVPPPPNNHPRSEQEGEAETELAPAEVPVGRGAFPGGSAAKDGDAFLGLAVALGLEACLAVLVILPLCGVRVPAWGLFFTVVPTLLLLALYGWASYRGRSKARDDSDDEEGASERRDE
jgi:DNA-binding response OmpR family regulator